MAPACENSNCKGTKAVFNSKQCPGTHGIFFSGSQNILKGVKTFSDLFSALFTLGGKKNLSLLGLDQGLLFIFMLAAK